MAKKNKDDVDLLKSFKEFAHEAGIDKPGYQYQEPTSSRRSGYTPPKRKGFGGPSERPGETNPYGATEAKTAADYEENMGEFGDDLTDPFNGEEKEEEEVTDEGRDADISETVKRKEVTKDKAKEVLAKNAMNENAGKKKLLRKILGKVKDAIVKLVVSHPIVALIVVAIILIICLLIYSFGKINNGDENKYRSQYAIQDLANDRFYSKRQEDMEAYQDIRDALEGELTADEIEELKEELLEYNHDISGYSNEMVSYYDDFAGFQILNQEGTVLVLLEQLSYAHNYTDWEPSYDYGGAKEDYYYALKQEVEDHQDGNGWSQIKLRSKTEELKEKEEEYEELDFEVARYIEMNKKYKEKIEKQFVNSSKQAKVHPDDEPVEDKVVEYFKDRYGVDTALIKKELTYYHTIMDRNMVYQKKFTDLNSLKTFLADPKFQKTEKTSEKDNGVDLAYVEKPFRARFEILHHEATLDLINNGNITNSVFDDPENLKKIKKTLANHMPLFEYATYDDKVAGKTFYNYELYDENYFNEDGIYVYDTNFNARLERYTKSYDTAIDFSLIENTQEQEYYLSRLENDLATTYDDQLKDILEKEIDEIREELEKFPTSDELMVIYRDNFEKVMNMSINLDNLSRPYDPHNHNIVTDTNEEYYIKYGDKLLDNYSENIRITETLTYNGGLGSGVQGVTYGGWVRASSALNDAGAAQTISATVTTNMEQSSLKPLKIRSVLNSADFSYEKEEERDIDVEAKLLEARLASHWEQREVYGPGGSLGTQYRKISEVNYTNTGGVVGSVDPFDTNTNMQLNSQTYLSDFYGQTELLTDVYDYGRPGNMGRGLGSLGNTDPPVGQRNYTPGNVHIVYYNQGNYPNSPYSTSTVKRSGCGPTCLAMVVDSLTSVTVGPEDMAAWAGENGYYVENAGSSRTLIPEGAAHFGLSSNSISYNDPDGVANALSNGHPVIMICGPGDFTTGGHFIVLTGIDENGMVSVNDPGSRHLTGQTFTLNKIMSNASRKADEYTFWEIY